MPAVEQRRCGRQEEVVDDETRRYKDSTDTAKKEDAMLPWRRNSEFAGKLNLKQPKNWPIPVDKRTSPINRTRN